MDTCKATRSDGSPCRAIALKTSEYCYWHDPASRERMLEGARRGGSRRTIELPDADMLTPGRARSIIAGMIESVASGAVDASTARTVGYLLQIEARIREGHDLEKRIEAMEVIQRKVG